MKIIKGKFLKVFLVLSLLVPFFMFNPIYASQQTTITFDNDTSLTGAVADVYEIGTYTLSNNKPTIMPLEAYGTTPTELSDQSATDTFMNSCVGIIKDSSTVVPDIKNVSIKNGVFDVEVGKVYIALVKKVAGDDKAVIDSANNKYVTKVDNERYKYEFTPMLYLAAVEPVAIPCKYHRTEKVGKISIEKELTSYRASKPVTFVFKISKIEGETTKELDVVSITFDRPGQRSLLVENIPIGVDIKVEEIYSGAGYTISDESNITQTKKIETEDKTISFSFENKFDEDKKKGYGISNTFERVSTGWNYVGNDVSTATGGTNE